MPEHTGSITRMAGKTVLITGGTGGIGKATAVGLARLGARVGIVGRDPSRAEAAAGEIATEAQGIAAGSSAAVDVFCADLSAQADVRRLAADVQRTYTRLDVLVNNVGGFWATRHTTADGLERTFAVNHLAPFLLTDLLLDLLKASAPARVVTVSSGAQAMGRIDFDDLQGERGYSGQRAYNQSKLANILFTYEQARLLDGAGVTANALHPGVVRTHFGHEDPTPLMGALIRVARPFMKTPAQGAATSIYLASAPEVATATGGYYVNSRPKRSSKRSYDVADAALLWRVSTELVGLTGRPGDRRDG